MKLRARDAPALDHLERRSAVDGEYAPFCESRVGSKFDTRTGDRGRPRNPSEAGFEKGGVALDERILNRKGARASNVRTRSVTEGLLVAQF